MTDFTYVMAEGVLDVVFLVQVLGRGFGYELVRRKHELPPAASTWLDMVAKWPVHDDIARFAIPAPAFVQNGSSLVALRNGQGLSNIAARLKADMEAFFRIPWYPERLAIVLDADDEIPDVRFAAFSSLLSTHAYPAPAALDMVHREGGRMSGVFSFPGGGRTGTLEDVLLPLADTRFPPVAERARDYVTAWCGTEECARSDDFKELRKPSGAKKATVSAIAALLKPAKPLAASIEDQRWVSELPDVDVATAPLCRFLKDLLPPMPADGVDQS